MHSESVAPPPRSSRQAPGVLLRYRATLGDPRVARQWHAFNSVLTEGIAIPAANGAPASQAGRETAETSGRPIAIDFDLVIAGDRWATTARLAGGEVSLFGDGSGGCILADHRRGYAGRVAPAAPAQRRRPRTALAWKPTGLTIETPAGPATVVEGRLRIATSHFRVRLAVADRKHLPVEPAPLARALVPPLFWGDGLHRALAGLGGIPARLELFLGDGLDRAAAVLELAGVEVLGDAVGRLQPPDLTPPAGGGGSFSLPRRKSHRPGHGLDADDLQVLVDAINLLLGAPIDAGLAFGPPFFEKLAALGSAAARLLLPLEDVGLQFQLDWFGALRARLIEIGWPPEVLDAEFAELINIWLNLRVGNADDLEDLADLASVLTEEEVAELEAILEADETWPDFGTQERRDEVALALLREVLAAPADIDLRPPEDFSGSLVESPIEGATARFAAGQVHILNLFGVMHLHLSNLRLVARAADTAVGSGGVEAGGAALTGNVEFFQLKFDFWTEPSAELWMIALRVLSLGLVDAALWNLGVGDVSMGPSAILGHLLPEREGDARLRTRWRPAAERSQVDTNFFAIGWNPLQDVALLLASAVVSVFDMISATALSALDRGLNAALDDRRILEFPRAFLCGGPVAAREEGADGATEVLGRPTRCEPVITPARSVYYRGIYGFMGSGVVDDPPFDPVLPRDGAYVVHRRVFDAMIARRSGLQGRRAGVTVAPPAGTANTDLFPSSIRNATELDAALLEAIGEAGFLTDDEVERWRQILEWLRPWLAFEGFPGGEIPLAGAIGRPRVYCALAPTVRWGDGLDGVEAGTPVAVARIEITGTHTMDLDFVAEDGRNVYELLRTTYERIDPFLLPQMRVRVPGRLGGVPLFDAVINRQMLLSVGLWSQGQNPIVPLPAPFEFSLDSLTELADGATTHRIDVPEFLDAAREQAVRARLGEVAAERLGTLTRPLANSARFFVLSPLLTQDLPSGLRWSVVREGGDPPREILTVRTRGDRLYLDFEADPLVLRDLEFDDLR